MASPYEPELPLLPYAGSSGWSGSDTSHERAERQDADGTTSARQQRVLRLLAVSGAEGITWRELAVAMEVHHGSASGTLSVLHKEGRIARLADVRRHRCAVYVLPEHVQGRATVAQGRSKRAVTDEEVEAAHAAWRHAEPGTFGLALVRVMLEAARDAAP